MSDLGKVRVSIQLVGDDQLIKVNQCNFTQINVTESACVLTKDFCNQTFLGSMNSSIVLPSEIPNERQLRLTYLVEGLTPGMKVNVSTREYSNGKYLDKFFPTNPLLRAYRSEFA
jgi:hypothetical protein